MKGFRVLTSMQREAQEEKLHAFELHILELRMSILEIQAELQFNVALNSQYVDNKENADYKNWLRENGKNNNIREYARYLSLTKKGEN